MGARDADRVVLGPDFGYPWPLPIPESENPGRSHPDRQDSTDNPEGSGKSP